MARKQKLTHDLIHEASNLIKAGNYVETVCQYFNIHRSTWYRWLQEGENARSGLKRKFHDEIRSAEAHAEIRNVNIIQSAGRESWQASAWYLERKYPDKWGRRERMDLNHGGDVGVKIEVDYGDEDEDD